MAQYSRDCDGCTLCCKLFHIPVLDKPAGHWCQHCAVGTGCENYEARPEQCRSFFCQWIKNDTLPDYWKPDRSRIVLTLFPANQFLYAQVDPARPDAWKSRRLFSDLKRWSAQFLKQRRHVVVFVHDEATLIMPDQAVPMGKLQKGEGFAVRTVIENGRRSYEVKPGKDMAAPLAVPATPAINSHAMGRL